MVERALLYALLALGIALGASFIADAIHTVSDRVECATSGASVCILDDAKEQ